MQSLYPVQPMINKYICYVEIDVKHHPKIQHINVQVFEWIAEVVVQLCTGIVASDLVHSKLGLLQGSMITQTLLQGFGWLLAHMMQYWLL